MTPSRPSSPAIGGRSAEANVKPWRRTRLEPSDSIGGPLDPAAPRALWRLVSIGEMAGLLTTFDQDATIEVFRTGGQTRTAVDAELDLFKCSLTDLYILVTLFSAAPRPVSLQVLARETYADSRSLRKSLDHLDELDAISVEGSSDMGSALQLTASGMNLAVILMYRVINAALPVPLANRAVRDDVEHTGLAGGIRRILPRPLDTVPEAQANNQSVLRA